MKTKQADKFREVSASSRCFFSVDTSDIIASSTRCVLNISLTGKVLFVRADTEIDTGNFHRILAKMGILKLAKYKVPSQK